MVDAVCTRTGPMRRLRLASLVLVAFGCSKGGEAPSGAPATASPATPAVTAAPTANPTPPLYAWANPITIAGVRFADHTWVTAFDAASSCPPPPLYWYSWGGCHATGPGTTATLLDHRPASVGVARCICQPDVEDYSFQAGDPAHGGIDYYGVSGVCHQLSNRILFATAGADGASATVSGAHGYGVSRFLYGTYGTDAVEWAARKTRCLAPTPVPTAAAGTPVAMALSLSAAMTPEADFAAMLRERLGPDVSRSKMAKLQQLHAKLQGEKARLDRTLLRGAMTPRNFAEGVNSLVNKYLGAAALTLDPAEYERLFGIPPGQIIGIVDPNIAERSNYKGRG
jgi:hypothetical protein